VPRCREQGRHDASGLVPSRKQAEEPDNIRVSRMLHQSKGIGVHDIAFRRTAAGVSTTWQWSHLVRAWRSYLET